MIVPDFFARELKLIDPTYRVEEPEDKNGFYIIKDIDLSLKQDGGESLPAADVKTMRITGPIPILWVPALTSQCLDTLRKMKRQALEMGIYEHPLKELAFYQRQRKEKQEKAKEEAVDMISEGLMKIDKSERSKTFT